ncbi:ribbon-helix-helix domain-containing protein [Desulfonatronovibrio magnus]|uniref:ribbon-helix-helix domain-containing protein n=1 Tax=Desulfonatronovibrio magnus TaxID=698827 RepID=UPI0005EBE842|nr:ribbon-helix-helix domain-containing protein [Desulfonatronovibrio magnus]
MNSVRWNVAVSAETDKALRVFLASCGQGRKGDLSRFIEGAVRERVFNETAQAVKEQNLEATPEEIESAVAEALDWSRKT